ncbi:hypothetical protein C0J52_22166 [Blattella germanica]|nr:hypothetical protein C0J52_22166 [Blattella germanica]
MTKNEKSDFETGTCSDCRGMHGELIDVGHFTAGAVLTGPNSDNENAILTSKLDLDLRYKNSVHLYLTGPNSDNENAILTSKLDLDLRIEVWTYGMYAASSNVEHDLVPCSEFQRCQSGHLTLRVFGDDAMGVTQIKQWFNRFKNGRKFVESDERPGRPQTARNAAVVGSVRNLILEDRRLTLREIAADVGISKDSAHAILRVD